MLDEREKGLYYKPANAYCGDVIPYYENGIFYIYYIHDYRNPQVHGEECPWNLLTTKDFVDYKVHGEVIRRGTKNEQDLNVCTGSVIHVGDTYYAFYAGANHYFKKDGKPFQKILLATSSDLINWKKRGDFVISAAEFLEDDDLRDPFVYYDEKIREYRMLITARLKSISPAGTHGAIIAAHTVNGDLFHWEYERQPFYITDGDYACECPDLFSIGNKWYLIMSVFTGRVTTVYRMADSPYGPWVTPENDSFDGFGSYAAKTVSDGKRRYLIGWNSAYMDDSDRAYRPWGGTIVPHELKQNPDGTLSVICPQQIREQYDRLYPTSVTEIINASVCPCACGSNFTMGRNGKQGLVIFGDLPQYCRIECDIMCSDKTGRFGLLFNCDYDMTQGYGIIFEPKFNRASLIRKPLWYSFFNQKNNEAEICCPINPGEKTHITVIICGTLIEAYIGERYVLGGRLNGADKGKLGIFSSHTTTDFTGLEIYTKE